MQLDLSPHARSPLSFHFYLCPFLFWNIHHRYFVTTNPNLLLFFFLFLTILRPSSSSEIPSTVALRSLGRSESHYSSPRISEYSQVVPSTSNPFSPVYHRRKFFNDEKKKQKNKKRKFSPIDYITDLFCYYKRFSAFFFKYNQKIVLQVFR
jgi:hypothetical protein